MQKTQTKAKKVSPLALHRETFRRLEEPELQGVAGGGRYWKPLGFADDTTPIYGEAEEP